MTVVSTLCYLEEKHFLEEGMIQADAFTWEQLPLNVIMIELNLQ